jgi:hypothetical protein
MAPACSWLGRFARKTTLQPLERRCSMRFEVADYPKPAGRRASAQRPNTCQMSASATATQTLPSHRPREVCAYSRGFHVLGLRGHACASSLIVARLAASLGPAESTPQQDRSTASPLLHLFSQPCVFARAGEHRGFSARNELENACLRLSIPSLTLFVSTWPILVPLSSWVMPFNWSLLQWAIPARVSFRPRTNPNISLPRCTGSST